MNANPNRYTVQVLQVGTLTVMGTTHVDADSHQDAVVKVARKNPSSHGGFFNVYHRASGSMQRYTYNADTDTAAVY